MPQTRTSTTGLWVFPKARGWLVLTGLVLLLIPVAVTRSSPAASSYADCDFPRLYGERDELKAIYDRYCGPQADHFAPGFDEKCLGHFVRWQEKEDEIAACQGEQGLRQRVRDLMDLYERSCLAGGGHPSECDWLRMHLRQLLEWLLQRYRELGCAEHPDTDECTQLAELIKKLQDLLGRTPPAPEGPAAASAALGGIDFTALQLTYVKDSGEARSPFFRVYSAPISGDGPFDKAKAALAAGLPRTTFSIGLAMPSRVFWVNLNPSEPNRIADRNLSTTDVARVLLLADLRLKKDASVITDPRTSEDGKTYWRRLEEAAGVSGSEIEIVGQDRVWIVPGRIVMAGDGQQAWIVEAGLDVQLESEHLAAQGTGNPGPASSQDARKRAEQVSKEIVLPRLREWVNQAPQYAELRQVFASLVLAAWCKSQHRERPAAKFDIDTGNLTGLQSRTAWKPETIWRDYIRSVRDGEYNFTEETRQTQGNVTTIRTAQYFSGGVDFTDIRIPPLTPLDAETSRMQNEVLTSGRTVVWRGRVWFSDLALAGTAAAGP